MITRITNIKIRTKFLMVFCIFLLEMLGFIFTSYSFFRKNEESLQELYRDMQAVIVVKDLQITLSQITIPLKDFLILGVNPDLGKNFSILDKRVGTLFAKLAKSKTIINSSEERFNRLKKSYFTIIDSCL